MLARWNEWKIHQTASFVEMLKLFVCGGGVQAAICVCVKEWPQRFEICPESGFPKKARRRRSFKMSLKSTVYCEQRSQIRRVVSHVLSERPKNHSRSSEPSGPAAVLCKKWEELTGGLHVRLGSDSSWLVLGLAVSRPVFYYGFSSMNLDINRLVEPMLHLLKFDI